MRNVPLRAVLLAASLLGAAMSFVHCTSTDEGPLDAGRDSGSSRDAGSSDGSGDGMLEASSSDQAAMDSGDAGDSGGPKAPAPAASVGYLVNTFSSTFAKSSIDLTDSRTSGFQWYFANFFAPTTPASDLTFNADGTVTMNGTGTASGEGLKTVSPSKTTAGWVGVAFGGGGYFEATFKFDPALVIANWNGGTNGWPAWWSGALESLTLSSGFYWPSQLPKPVPEGGCSPTLCYTHSIEPDFFEYDTWDFTPDAGSYYTYGGAVHDHYGVYKKTCPAGYCEYTNTDGLIHVDAGFDFDDYHSYGFLWVPATASVKGYAQYYLDGQLTTDHISWSQYTGDESPPPSGDAGWTFGVIDGQHLVLYLGTGDKQLVTLQSVDVWQASAAGNLTE